MVANQRPVGAPFNKRLPHPSPKGPILSEDIFVCCIGHAFGEVPPTMLPPGAQPIYFVTDFLIDQSQSTGGGSFLADPIQFDLTQSTWVYVPDIGCLRETFPCKATGQRFRRQFLRLFRSTTD